MKKRIDFSMFQTAAAPETMAGGVVADDLRLMISEKQRMHEVIEKIIQGAGTVYWVSDGAWSSAVRIAVNIFLQHSFEPLHCIKIVGSCCQVNLSFKKFYTNTNLIFFIEWSSAAENHLSTNHITPGSLYTYFKANVHHITHFISAVLSLF